MTENSSTSESLSLQNFLLLWKPSQDHSTWLRELVCCLITNGGVSDEVLSLVKPVCQVKLSFCESVFPLVVHDILSSNTGDKSIMESLSKQVNNDILKYIFNYNYIVVGWSFLDRVSKYGSHTSSVNQFNH